MIYYHLKLFCFTIVWGKLCERENENPYAPPSNVYTILKPAIGGENSLALIAQKHFVYIWFPILPLHKKRVHFQ